MANPARIWRLISWVLAGALIVALIQLHQAPTTTRPGTSTLTTVNNIIGYEHLALSPITRRAHERYSL